jgi:hypothetical protein
MRIKDYQYGKPSKSLRNAVTFLNRNKHKIIDRYKKEYPDEYHFCYLDYPDYFDIPKRISCRLGSDEVDWLQDETADWLVEDNHVSKL